MYNKYIKYKNKYLIQANRNNNFKNVIYGGTIEYADIDVEYISNELNKKQNNLGQRNCGIIFINNYAIKCLKFFENNQFDKILESEILKLEEINNDLYNLFVKYYRWPDGNLFNFIELTNNINGKIITNYAKCVIMEKLDGDLTNYIVKYAYEKAYNYLENDVFNYYFDFFYQRIPKTTIEYIKIKDDTLENKMEFNEIINNIKQYILSICNYLNSQIIFLHHELIKKGWQYYDFKLDNIGYKIENKNIKLLFIDEESGLNKILYEYTQYQDYLNLYFINTHLGEYGIFGQYNLKHIFNIDLKNFIPKFDNDNYEFIIETLKIKNIIKVNENQSFNWIHFNHLYYNNSFVIQFIMGFYRLVFFDDYLRHISHPDYNTYFNLYKIDELFYSIDSLYEKLDELYN
jgi:hypothetical protein